MTLFFISRFAGRGGPHQSHWKWTGSNCGGKAFCELMEVLEEHI